MGPTVNYWVSSVEQRTNPRVDEKSKRFFSKDHCHICGVEFQDNEQFYHTQAQEISIDEPVKLVDVNVCQECLYREVDH